MLHSDRPLVSATLSRWIPLLLCLGATVLHGQARLPAFPGAEGFGAYAAGGRGGDVYTVRNLSGDPDVEGSLAHGLATAPDSGRTIVFAVSGYIPAPPKNLRVAKPRVTIAGQTAPGGGVGLRGGTLLISAPEVVIRHFRLRHGRDGRGGDCLNLDANADNVMLDHLSMQFSADENMSSFKRPPDNLTLQYSLNAWGLETHSCGGLWDQNHATAHHNLWAHNHTRNPKARPDGLLEWINNVTFDWNIGFILGDSHTPANWKANLVANYFISPPGNLRLHAVEKGWLDKSAPRRPNFSLHLAGNLIDNDGDGHLNGVDRGWDLVNGRPFDPDETVPAHADTPKVPRYEKRDTAFPGSPAGVTTDSARLAYKKVASAAGALRLDALSGLPLRDEVDSILIEKLLTQTRFHVGNEKETGAADGGFGVLHPAPAPLDSDGDGMPDLYETALGWNASAQDHNTTLPSSDGRVSTGSFLPAGAPAGHTRLDEYLHFMASPHATAAGGAAIVVDLARYCGGFRAQAPVFTLGDVSGGTAVQARQGGCLVTFTPTAGRSGRAGFDFTVVDAEGDRWTRSFLILLPSPKPF
jgi:hypothetical protein